MYSRVGCRHRHQLEIEADRDLAFPDGHPLASMEGGASISHHPLRYKSERVVSLVSTIARRSRLAGGGSSGSMLLVGCGCVDLDRSVFSPIVAPDRKLASQLQQSGYRTNWGITELYLSTCPLIRHPSWHRQLLPAGRAQLQAAVLVLRDEPEALPASGVKRIVDLHQFRVMSSIG
jgi:hypothetical protein